MSSKDDYLNRLWSLNKPTGPYRVKSSADLLKVLRKDFEEGREIFSLDEYKDPLLRETILDDITHPERSLYSFPANLARFICELIGQGPLLSLYSGFGDLLFECGSGIGVEPNGSVAEWSSFFAATAGLDVQIMNDDPLQWSTENKFGHIVCNPPFGARDAEAAAIEKALSLMKKDGLLAVIVSPNFLWGTRQAKTRETILKRASVRAVISLPPNVFARTSIQSAILILDQRRDGKTYMARSKNVADLDAIANDYRASRQGQKFTLGFEVALDSGRWDVAHHEPVDFGLGGLTFPYKLVPLGDIAEIQVGKSSEAGKVAVNRTGSKVVWVADEPKLIPKNNIFIAPNKEVNPSYLHLYLNSTIGKRALAGLVKGAYIPHISAKELAGLPVVLPELRQQNQIVADALDLGQTIASLQALTTEGEQALRENLFGLTAAKEKFQNSPQRRKKLDIGSCHFQLPWSSERSKMLRTTHRDFPF